MDLDKLFENIKNITFTLLKEKNININALLFDLGIDKETFIKNYTKRIEDFTFYLEALSLVEHWEG